MAIPLHSSVTVLLIDGNQVNGEVAQADQVTYLCLKSNNETLYFPWSAIKCVRGPAIPDRSSPGSLMQNFNINNPNI